VTYVDATEIAGALDLPYTETQARLREHRLALRHRGQDVAYLTVGDGTGLIFYGQAPESPCSRENIYWVEGGDGVEMPGVDGAAPGPYGTGGTFLHTVDEEEEHWAVTAYTDDPAADYWVWDYLIGGYAGMNEKSFTVPSPGAAASGAPAMLTVRLQGGTDSPAAPDHHVKIRFNGVEMGDTRWNGTDGHTFAFMVTPDLLEDGENTVDVIALLDEGVPYSVVYVDGFELAYPRHFRAVGNRLTFTAENDATITVDGFTGPDILVLEITDPLQPKRLMATTVDETEGGHAVRFVPDEPAGRYIAVTREAYGAPASVTGREPSVLDRSANRADYVIITTAGLRDAAEALAEYRQSDGLETMVVTIEEIMDAFNDGIDDPAAIRDFLSFAHENWHKAPEYVVLAGEGTYDYLDRQGHGDNLVPPLMVGTPWGLFAGDNRYADVAGDDGIPEIAVGRLPVVTPAELSAVIEKIRVYESGLGYRDGSILLVADNADTGGNFPLYSDRIAEGLPEQCEAEKIYLSDLGIDQTRQRLFDGFDRGPVYVNYLGHSTVGRMAQEGILDSNDVAAFGNLEGLPVMTAMTCVLGQFAIPGFDALSEQLVLHPLGGLAAVWAPTGLSMNDQAAPLAEAFYQYAYSSNGARLGDAVRLAMATHGHAVDRHILDVYTVLGDPALRLW
jgi:hypothetical protein